MVATSSGFADEVMNIDDLTNTLELREPATTLQVTELVKAAGRALPPSYLAFLRRSNGAEGFVGGGGFVALWPGDEVLSDAPGYRALAPWLLPFASDGSDSIFAFDLDSGQGEDMKVVQTHLLDVGKKEMETARGRGFLTFLEALASENAEPAE